MVNDILLKPLVKGAVKILPSMMPKLEEFLCEQLTSCELHEGETRATYLLLVGKDGKPYFVLSYLDHEDRVVRSEQPTEVAQFLTHLIEQYSHES